MDISAIALSGLQQAQGNLERAAQQVANPGNPVDTVSLSNEAVALISAKNQFAANINVLKTADDMEKTALSLARPTRA